MGWLPSRPAAWQATPQRWSSRVSLGGCTAHPRARLSRHTAPHPAAAGSRVPGPPAGPSAPSSPCLAGRRGRTEGGRLTGRTGKGVAPGRRVRLAGRRSGAPPAAEAGGLGAALTRHGVCGQQRDAVGVGVGGARAQPQVLRAHHVWLLLLAAASRVLLSARRSGHALAREGWACAASCRAPPSVAVLTAGASAPGRWIGLQRALRRCLVSVSPASRASFAGVARRGPNFTGHGWVCPRCAACCWKCNGSMLGAALAHLGSQNA